MVLFISGTNFQKKEEMWILDGVYYETKPEEK